MASLPHNRALLALAATLLVSAPLAASAPARQIALDHLNASAGTLGLAEGDLREVIVAREYSSAHNGLTHVHFQQTANGIAIDGAEIGVHVDARGRVIHVAGRLVRGLEAAIAASARLPILDAMEAVDHAARQLGLGRARELRPIDFENGLDRAERFWDRAISSEPIPVRLRYWRAPDTERIVLTWLVDLKDPNGPSWWTAYVDAGTGELVHRDDYTDDATYRVFASPFESPGDGARTDEVDPHLDGGSSPVDGASPFGWHDLNGVTGAETTLTSGNNVNACTDTDANNACDPGSQPDGGGPLVFQPPIDLATQQPADYRPAAVVNLYYWNNLMHDISYQYGFDEASGNFQENNYGRGGAGSDSVSADAQDGSGTNNANFSTPADGANPRMQMFVWTAPVGLEINSPPVIAGTYPAGTASFGPQTYNITDDVVLVNDGSGAFTDDGCCNDGNTLCVAPVWPGVSGNIALLRRGQCEFGTKAVNAQNAGAVGVILINNQGDGTVAMGPGVNGGASLIPMLSVGQSDGNLFVAQLPSPGVNATMDSSQAVGPNRDSDLDAGVIAHEYGHGISNRLTGTGPGCLGNAEQMGEGWSDWQTLFLHAAASDTATTSRSVGGYLVFDGPNGVGIRRFPYTTDMAVNPFTYADVADPVNTQPHGIGSIWATMVWDMYWNLVAQQGYDPDVYGGDGGNNVAYQLVMDGLKLQPCQPGFVDGRNAILAADAANYEADNRCDIWDAFAQRGLGSLASQGSSNNRSDGVEDFTLPAECVDLIFEDGFGMGSVVRWSSEAL